MKMGKFDSTAKIFQCVQEMVGKIGSFSSKKRRFTKKATLFP